MPRRFVQLWCLIFLAMAWAGAASAAGYDLFARSNLVAWCIVPFDSAKRGPEARAAMLEKLGFTQLAYDYRAEHIPTFDAEMEALKRHRIRLLAWWFPGALNDEARLILDILQRHQIRGVQLWVTGGGAPPKDATEQAARVRSEAARLKPIALEATKLGGTVALYNHGGWFGEPENQLEIIRALQEQSVTNVGIVYNLHHGHEHLDRFPALLEKMKPCLLALNLNGMTRDGDKQGKKILVVGQGELDLQLLRIVRDSGWRGPIGILNHTDEDAEVRLRANLGGLDRLVKELGTASSALPRISIALDGRGFQTSEGLPFVPFGVNFFRPHTGWAPQLWKQYDSNAIAGDLRRLKELGGNCVRVFLSYGSFFTEPDRLNPEGLARLDHFLSVAEANGIYVHPTGLDHWEGVPAWARTDRFSDEPLLRAQEQFWRLLAARYRNRSVLFAYDLLNEPAIPWDNPTLRARWNDWLRTKYGTPEKVALSWGQSTNLPPLGEMPPPAPQPAPGSRHLLDYQTFREEIADTWTRRQVAAIRAADPQALVTVGLIQWSVPSLLPGVQHYSGFRPSRQAPLLDFLEVHFYPLEAGAYAYRGAAEEARNLAYLHSVVSEVARAGRPVVVAEFGWYGGGQPRFNGGKQPAATEEQQARWCRRLVETTEVMACGWLNWGFYDHPEARDVTELTGLLTVTGETKQWGHEFARLAGRLTSRVQTPSLPKQVLPLDWDRVLTDPASATAWRREYQQALGLP